MKARELVELMYGYAAAITPLTMPKADRDRVATDADARITGIGQGQYQADDGSQRFETMPLPELLEYAREEALDLVNYGTMLAIRLTNECPEFERRHHIAKHIARGGLELAAEIGRVATVLSTELAAETQEDEGQA